MALKGKQQVFVDEYLKDLNASKAALRAGYSPKTAAKTGFENLQKPEISAAIQAAMRARGERTKITADRVLEEIARLSFFDPRKLFNADGSPKPISELDDSTAAAITGLEAVNIGNSDVGVGQVLKYKIADKNAAIEKLCKHLGLYNEQSRIDETPKEPVVFFRDE